MARICLDCRYVGARPSGIGEVSRALAQHVPALAPQHEFVILCPPHSPLLDLEHTNAQIRVVRAKANGPATMWAMARCTDLGGIDLFHAPFNILPAPLGMKTVVTVHDIMWLTDPQWCRAGLRGRVERAFYGHGIRRALRRADRIATVSEASARAIARHTPDGAQRIRVTLSGVSPRFRPREGARGALFNRLGLRPDRRLILTVGQYAPYKNHEGALEAFARALGKDQFFDLVFVQRQGNGARRLRRLARQRGIEERVHTLPALDEDDLIALYSHAQLLLHPSLCEGFGNPIAEAMACGCPVITGNRGAMAEVAGSAGWLVDPENPDAIARAIRALCDDRALAERLSRQGRARARELTWEKFARANLAIYNELLD